MMMMVIMITALQQHSSVHSEKDVDMQENQGMTMTSQWSLI